MQVGHMEIFCSLSYMINREKMEINKEKMINKVINKEKNGESKELFRSDYKRIDLNLTPSPHFTCWQEIQSQWLFLYLYFSFPKF